MKKILTLFFFSIAFFSTPSLALADATEKQELSSLTAKQIVRSLATKLGTHVVTKVKNVIITMPVLFSCTDLIIERNIFSTEKFIFCLVLTHYTFADSLFEAVANALKGLRDCALISNYRSSARRYYGHNFKKTFLIVSSMSDFVDFSKLYTALTVLLSEKKIKAINTNEN